MRDFQQHLVPAFLQPDLRRLAEKVMLEPDAPPPPPLPEAAGSTRAAPPPRAGIQRTGRRKSIAHLQTEGSRHSRQPLQYWFVPPTSQPSCLRLSQRLLPRPGLQDCLRQPHPLRPLVRWMDVGAVPAEIPSHPFPIKHPAACSLPPSVPIHARSAVPRRRCSMAATTCSPDDAPKASPKDSRTEIRGPDQPV